MRNWHQIVVVLWCLITGSQSRAGSIDTISKILNKGNYSELVRYFSELKNKKEYSIIWQTERELVTDYWEIKISYTESYPSDNPNAYRLSPYFINLLVKDSNIFHAVLSEDRSFSHAKIVMSFTNESEFNSLSRSFNKIYKKDLNFSYLFLKHDSLIYGTLCYDAAREPLYRFRLNEAVKSMDTLKLEEWLSHTITEIQVYAVEGFYRLKQQGYIINPETLSKIKAVKAKKGTVFTCSGCILGRQTIKKLTANFVFE